MSKKGYWIAHVDVTDPESYKDYIAANAVAFRQYGGRFLVRGGASETMEGRFRARTVIVEFKDYATALACYQSAEYAGAMAIRKGRVGRRPQDRGRIRRGAAGGFVNDATHVTTEPPISSRTAASVRPDALVTWNE